MDVKSFLENHGVHIAKAGQHHHARSGWFQVDCPYCINGAGRKHLGFSERRGKFNCWKCGKHGTIKTIALLCKISYGAAKRAAEGFDNQFIEEVEAHTGVLKLPEGRRSIFDSPAHVDYLESRGLNPKKIVDTWGVEAITYHVKFKWRLFIPIMLNWKTVSFTTRSIQKNAGLRYLSASMEEESIPHKRLLYGEDYAGLTTIVLEGPIDVWSVGPGAVGTCGTGYSSAQLLRISRFTKRAICFDSSPEAQERARELCDALSVFPGETYNVELDAKDANEATRKEINVLRRHFL